MQNLACLQFLLLSIFWKSTIETTIGLSWPVRSSNVKLLGLFPQQIHEESKNDMWIVHCRSMFRAAIQLSQEYNITFQGQFLGYEEIITDADIMVTIDHTCQKVSTSTIIGFIGPAYSKEARYLASFAYRLGILSVSYSATSPDLSTIDNGAFYRLVPSDENTALSMIILFQQYKWKSCTIIYQNDEYGYSGMKLLRQKFSEMNIKILEIIKFDMNEQNLRNNFTEILHNGLSRVIIVWAYEESTLEIINKALEGNLLGKDFLWILTTTIPLDHFNQKNTKDLIGILAIEPDKGDFFDISINKTLLNRAYQLWKSYDSDTFPGDTNVSSYALFTFDATWSLILSLQQLCSMQSSCLELMNVSNCFDRQFINSKQYYNIMKIMTFLGVSGEVKFSNGTADRVGHVYYIIKNIQPSNTDVNSIDYFSVLKWDVNSTKWTSYKNESDQIIWPNLSKNVPADHRLIRGQELRMAVIHSPPFIILKNPTATCTDMTDNYKKINISEIDGFFKDVLSYLQDRMGFIPVIMLANQTTQYDELVNGVAKDLFDIVLGPMTITPRRTELVDFSIPIIPRSIRIIIRKPESIHLDSLFFLKPFSWKLWILLLITILYISILIWYFERQNNTRLDSTVNDNEHLSIGKSISYVTSTILGKSPFSVVSTNAGRFLTYGVYLLQVILFAVYAASLLSSIMIQNSDTLISGIDDIKNGKIPPYRIGIVVGSSIEYYYLNAVSQDKKDYYPLMSVNEIYTSLMNNDIDAAIWSNLSTGYHANNIYCELMTVGVEFGLSSYQFPVKHDWLYTADLDSNILSLIDSQEFDRISAKWLAHHTCTGTHAFDTKIKLITIEAMGGLFVIFAVISIISVLVHFWSKMADCRQNIMNSIRRRLFNNQEEKPASVAPGPPEISLVELIISR